MFGHFTKYPKMNISLGFKLKVTSFKSSNNFQENCKSFGDSK